MLPWTNKSKERKEKKKKTCFRDFTFRVRKTIVNITPELSLWTSRCYESLTEPWASDPRTAPVRKRELPGEMLSLERKRFSGMFIQDAIPGSLIHHRAKDEHSVLLFITKRLSPDLLESQWKVGSRLGSRYKQQTRLSAFLKSPKWFLKSSQQLSFHLAERENLNGALERFLMLLLGTCVYLCVRFRVRVGGYSYVLSISNVSLT